MQTDLFPQIVTQRKRVPNVQPILPAPYRIALIGEAPGEEEEYHGYPFIGKSGSLLNSLLKGNHIDRNACFVGNCIQFRPPNNDISRAPASDFTDGAAQLSSDLENFNPHISVLLGNTPLHQARDGGKITAWRGSLFRSQKSGPFLGRKCLPALHPAGILREWGGFPLLNFDLKRAREEGTTSELHLPTRSLITDLDGPAACHLMDSWPSGVRCSVDIEGYYDNWPCVSICSSPLRSWTIAWGKFDAHWHGQVLRSFARLMDRWDVPKVLQNQLSDNWKLCYGFGIHIRNVTEDTMIKGWEIYAELPRALETQASIYTREPHWKDNSMYSTSGEGLFRGCAIDTAVTLEVCIAQDSILTGPRLQHYRTMIELQRPFLFMELRGIKYNAQAAADRLKLVYEGYTETDDGKEVRKTGMNEMKEVIFSELNAKPFGPKGSISSTQLIKLLYDTGKYPPQFKKEKGRKTTKQTADEEALLRLKRHRPQDNLLDALLRHRHLEGVRKTLQFETDPDGRIRAGYSLEAETGRVKCYTSPTGSGGNLQTIQKDLRYLYEADPGYDFNQNDLEGADGWTVAAHSARLGDSTMLEDYLAGMKPAKIIGLMYHFGEGINKLSRPDLKWLHDNVFPIIVKIHGKWLYLGCKRVQHGSSYLMGIPTMQKNVLLDSYGESGVPIYMEAADAEHLQTLFFTRYRGVRYWHEWARSKLMTDAELTSASGNVRVFFGRRFGNPAEVEATLREFLAHEPQNNTTWATNLAMLKLWNDPANRVRRVLGRTIICCDGSLHYVPPEHLHYTSRLRPGSLLIEPLHQVHDALCTQWLQFMREWARKKIPTYFDNVITIAGIPIRIPFDGTWGPSWGDMPNGLN